MDAAQHGWTGVGEGLRTLVFWITRCLGESIRATKDVENSISIMAMFPSSLLKILENGSVWNIRKPLDVPTVNHGHRPYIRNQERLVVDGRAEAGRGVGLPTAKQL
jgi:hypothetical protein